MPKQIRPSKNISYKNLKDILCSDFKWNKNAFSNNCGKIDFVNGFTGLMPHQGWFIKRLFRKASGENISLKQILAPTKTYIKFVPEMLTSSYHSRDVNFWLTFFKENINLGRLDNDNINIFGLPTNEMVSPKDISILNKDLLFLGFSPNTNGVNSCVLDLNSNYIWCINNIVFYACGAILISK